MASSTFRSSATCFLTLTCTVTQHVLWVAELSMPSPPCMARLTTICLHCTLSIGIESILNETMLDEVVCDVSETCNTNRRYIPAASVSRLHFGPWTISLCDHMPQQSVERPQRRLESRQSTPNS